MTSSWPNVRWHHSVHEKFDEYLVFYRARLKQFHPEKTKATLERLFAGEQLRNLAVAVVFGSTDLLIYGYLHRTLIEDFRFKLAEALGTEITPEFFAVSQRENHKFGAAEGRTITRDPDLYSLLEPQTVRTVQSGSNPQLLSRLSSAGFIEPIEDFGEQVIRFFMALAMETTEPHLDRAYTTLSNHLSRQKTLAQARVYRGTGFAKFLIDASVLPENYFTAGELSKWIMREFDPFQAMTETYLVSESDPLLPGQGIIDDKTFIARRAISPFINSILQQVYLTASAISDQIILVLSDPLIQPDTLSPKDRTLLGKFLAGVLDNDEALAATTLFFFLSQLEGYFRTAHAKYAALKDLNLKEIYEIAGVRENTKNLTLIDLCNILIKIFERVNNPALSDSAKHCHHLLPLRNKLAHGSYDFSNWQTDLHVLIDILPHIRRVLDELKGGTGLAFTF